MIILVDKVNFLCGLFLCEKTKDSNIYVQVRKFKHLGTENAVTTFKVCFTNNIFLQRFIYQYLIKYWYPESNHNLCMFWNWPYKEGGQKSGGDDQRPIRLTSFILIFLLMFCIKFCCRWCFCFVFIANCASRINGFYSITSQFVLTLRIYTPMDSPWNGFFANFQYQTLSM